MSELQYDSDAFTGGEQGIDQASSRVATFMSRLQDLQNRTLQAAGSGSDGQTFLQSVNPIIDDMTQGVQGISDGLSAARLSLEQTSKVLEGANDVNNDSVPTHDSPAAMERMAREYSAAASGQAQTSGTGPEDLRAGLPGTSRMGGDLSALTPALTGPASLGDRTVAVPAGPAALEDLIAAVPAGPASLEDLIAAVPAGPSGPEDRVAAIPGLPRTPRMEGSLSALTPASMMPAGLGDDRVAPLPEAPAGLEDRIAAVPVPPVPPADVTRTDIIEKVPSVATTQPAAETLGSHGADRSADVRKKTARETAAPDNRPRSRKA
jgi:hypothetical protein